MDVMEDFQTHVWSHWWEATTQAGTLPPHSKDESQVFVLSRGLPVSCQVGGLTPGDFTDPCPGCSQGEPPGLSQCGEGKGW